MIARIGSKSAPPAPDDPFRLVPTFPRNSYPFYKLLLFINPARTRKPVIRNLICYANRSY